MRFKVGDKAVYPAHGAAVIERIEEKEISGERMAFYVLKVLATGNTLMVSVAASEKAGMRCPISDIEIQNILSILQLPSKVSQKSTWNRRFREFNEKLRTGSVSDIAEVLRDLWSLQTIKELSYGEKKMLEKSKSLIVSEICAARNHQKTEVELEIESLLTIH